MRRVKSTELPPPDPRILEEMLAARQPPGLKGTDRAFLQGRLSGQSLDRMDPLTRATWLEKAKQRGVSLAGKVYQSGIGLSPSDPWDLSSWIDSRSEQIQRCKALGRNLYVNGECVYAAPEKEPEPEVLLAPSIVEREVNNLIKKEPGLKSKDRRELRERVIDKHAYKAGKKR